MTQPRMETDNQTELPRAAMEQVEIQSRLQIIASETGTIDAALRELESWSRDVGYFAHLKRTNEVLRFQDPHWDAEFRLQINYSRLGYQAPAGERPACPLCYENIGVPGKELLRVFEFQLNATDYFSHLTPFPLCPGHFVLNRRSHEPMRIDEQALHDAGAFLEACPGWLAASNSDVEWAGASILGHHHAQVFSEFHAPVESAHLQDEVDSEGVAIGLVRWPAPVLRLRAEKELVLAMGTRILQNWKATAPGKATANFLLRETHPGEFTLHLFPRHPAFRTMELLRDIKAEGVGIIEMAGEIIVPPRQELSVDENVEFFRESGPRVINGILSSNGPSIENWKLII